MAVFWVVRKLLSDFGMRCRRCGALGALLLVAMGMGMACSASSDPPSGTVQWGPDGGGTDAGTGGGDATVHGARIRIHYPAGAGAHVFSLTAEKGLPGQLPPLANTANGTWELTVENLGAPLSFRPARDGKAARGPLYQVHPGETLDVYPWFDRDTGTLAGLHDDFESRILDNVRGIRMYTPPSYQENTLKRYPVLYMHDGQILFDKDMAIEDGLAKSSFGTWKLETVMDSEIAAGRIPEAIVIGIDIVLELNPSEPTRQRTRELTPTPDDAFVGFSGTGQGPRYLRMVIDELRPFVNQQLRSIPDREHTFLLGSSLGGLINVWAGLYHGDTFGAIASLSTASYWDHEVIVARANALRTGPTTTSRIYLDVGRDERESGGDPKLNASMPTAEQQARLEAALVQMGYVKGQTLTTMVDPIGKHHGISWNRRVPVALSFLLGAGPRGE